MTEFAIKDSGERQEFSSGMVRDTTEGKTNFLSVRFGPMLRRWADHLTKGREKYPDPEPGVPNWTLAEGTAEFLRAKESAARHFEQWLDGDRDEDHAAAVFFNINLAEYVLERDSTIDPALGATTDPIAIETAEEFLASLRDLQLDLPPASKPWTIVQDSIAPAEEREGKWEGTLGFSVKVPDEPQQPRPFQVGDVVRHLSSGDTAQVFQVEAPMWPVRAMFLTGSDRYKDAAFFLEELELVEPACNSNCLGCDC